MYFFVEYLPQDDRKMSKHVGGLADLCHCISTLVQLLVYMCWFVKISCVI